MPFTIRGRWDRAGVYYADLVAAALLLVFSLLAAATSTPTPQQRGADTVTYVLIIVVTVPLVVHRRFPIAALTVTVAGFLALSALHTAFYPGLQLFALLGGIALHADRRRSLIALAVCMVTMVAGLAMQPAGVTTTADWTSSLLAVAVAWLIGEYLRNRRTRWAAIEERAAFLERERLARDRQAALAERLRLARELHDVVAHSMSVIAIQSGAAHHLIDTNPTEAARALDLVETTSRQAMAEMRQLVGVLRDADGQLDSTTPAPGLRDVPALVAAMRAAGLGVNYHLEGAGADLPAAIATSVYRIVQEGLTNVIKHGGPVATVTIHRHANVVHVDVHDDGPGHRPRGTPSGGEDPHGGHGLIGMRERVAIFNGELTYGPRPGGGFGIVAVLPWTGETPTALAVDPSGQPSSGEMARS